MYLLYKRVICLCFGLGEAFLQFALPLLLLLLARDLFALNFVLDGRWLETVCRHGGNEEMTRNKSRR